MSSMPWSAVKKKKREGKKEKTGTLVAQRIFSFNSPSTDSMLVIDYILQLPRWHNHKESACQCRRCKRHGFDPWVGKIPWSRKWQPTLVFLPGKFHGQRNLVGYSLWGHKESDTPEWLSTHTHIDHILRIKLFNNLVLSGLARGWTRPAYLFLYYSQQCRRGSKLIGVIIFNMWLVTR